MIAFFACPVDIFNNSYALIRIKVNLGLMTFLFSPDYFIMQRLVTLIALHALCV